MICGKNRKSIFLLLCILALSLNWYCIAPVFAGELPAADTESVSQDGSSGILQEEQEEQEESSGTSVADPPPDDPVTPPDDSSTPPDNPVTPPDSPVTPPDLPDNPDPPAENYTVVLDTMTVSEGEYIGYTVISPEFAGGSLPEGYYPGNLTVQISGRIVVENGGTLSIGTLSVGSDEEIPPVISGTLSEEGLIIVKAGGTLELTGAVFDTAGEGFLIVQEPGASVTLTDVQSSEGLVSWSPPLVHNEYDTPDDVYLEEGTLLTQEHLPSSMQSNLQYMGSEDRTDITLLWDMSGYAGETSGEITISGSFTDENGQPLLAFRPLTLTVHWYKPGSIAVTEASWNGKNACTARLTVPEFPEYAEIYGEVSCDEGQTWIRWNDDVFDIVRDTDGNHVCIFEVPDDMPRWYRIAAEDSWTPEFWVSEAFLLPEDESDDQSGNRGGSTSPVTPDRTPEPEPTPDSEPEPEKLPDSITDPFPLPDDAETEIPASGQESPSEQPLTPDSAETSSGGSTVIRPDENISSSVSKEKNPLSVESTDAVTPSIGYFSSVPEKTLSHTPVAGSSSQENGSPDDDESAVQSGTLLQETDSVAQNAEDSSAAPRILSRPSQILLAAAGIVLCVIVAAAASGVFRFRRRK